MRTFDKSELGRIARQYGFVRDTFEKVIRLTDILRFINKDGFLNEHLVPSDLNTVMDVAKQIVNL